MTESLYYMLVFKWTAAICERVVEQFLIPDAIPPYKHDCESCVWVGWYTHTETGLPWANVYLCNTTLIFRYSSEPSDYSTMLIGNTKGSISGVGLEECHRNLLRRRCEYQHPETCSCKYSSVI